MFTATSSLPAILRAEDAGPERDTTKAVQHCSRTRIKQPENSAKNSRDWFNGKV